MRYLFRSLLIVVSAATASWAAAGGGEHSESTFYRDLLGLVLIILAAKLGAELFERLKQPGVLGELVVGMTMSGLALAGVSYFAQLRDSPGLHVVAEVGVILLLFEVGLHSRLHELLEVGLSAALVATLGVIGPVLLGFWVSELFRPEEPWYVHLFVGSTLAATSVGITARVLQDLNKLNTIEARIILGAAVVDDVLGLIILALISGIVSSIAAGTGPGIEATTVLMIIVKATLFLVAAIVLGRFVHLNAVRFGTRFRVPGVPVVIACSFCFTLAALAGEIGLAPIVGAFAAGLVLEPSDYEVYQQRGELPIDKLIRPMATVLTPVFFVMMGLRVDLRAFTAVDILGFAVVVTLAAIAGKQMCSLGVLQKGVDRIVVGVGMIPRGEVGLIFTGMGARMAVHGEPVFSASTVSAMIFMVMVTTLITPPVLKVLLARHRGS